MRHLLGLVIGAFSGYFVMYLVVSVRVEMALSSVSYSNEWEQLGGNLGAMFVKNQIPTAPDVLLGAFVGGLVGLFIAHVTQEQSKKEKQP